MNFTKYSNQIVLALITVIVSFLFWSAFYLNTPQFIGFPKTQLETIFANYDGPNYMVIAKCGYNKNCIGQNFSLPQPLEYYPAHLPGYPLLIKFFALFTTGPKAMLVATLLGSIFLTVIFFQFLKLFVKEKTAFWLSLLLLFFPARLFVLRLIGAPETWFLASVIASIYFFKKEKIWLAVAFAALAQALKSPGIVLLAAYFVLFLKERNLKKYFPFAFVPLVILLVFYFYRFQIGDFWAYFHSGDNFHLSWPYQVFLSQRSWINTIWLEDVIYIFLLAFVGIYYLWQKHKFDLVVVFPALFTLASVLIAHRDVSRYIAPVYPFLILAFAPILEKKFSKIIFILLLPAIILYAINFLIGNIAPIADWTPYLRLN
ncbi:hypothetical protein A3K55_02720 [Candidatus Shapirobacteria bacterium RBG_13_44_7]|uniref:Glycosyltransferase RgtA/B/C/D-like domain-containing protein n=1 Tax=Candidatus Shapirobacteria bacterium RBG_13_44_7 TaxID=1802149 RepID=A0A1F7SET6_9BACT|nr:MAG: hypothetical protein A3K55_02720 [Candidatus Shapirobacteria bacterium RBG_13_44_7]